MDTLHILYTANLRGDMEILPRLYSFIERIEQQRGIKTLRLDLGNSCAPDAWHCDATEGRSMPVVLDGMGFHAANVSGMSADSRYKLSDTVNMGLVDAQHTWRYDVPPERDEGMIISATPSPALRLCIVIAPAAKTTLVDKMLFFQTIDAGQIGLVSIAMTDDEPTLISDEILTLPADARPDATIAAVVQFVQDEARFYAKKSPRD